MIFTYYTVVKFQTSAQRYFTPPFGKVLKVSSSSATTINTKSFVTTTTIIIQGSVTGLGEAETKSGTGSLSIEERLITIMISTAVVSMTMYLINCNWYDYYAWLDNPLDAWK